MDQPLPVQRVGPLLEGPQVAHPRVQVQVTLAGQAGLQVVILTGRAGLQVVILTGRAGLQVALTGRARLRAGPAVAPRYLV